MKSSVSRRLGERLAAGMVGINRGLVADHSAPFGGVKQTGIGHDGVRAGLQEYLDAVLQRRLVADPAGLGGGTPHTHSPLAGGGCAPRRPPGSRHRCGPTDRDRRRP
ncbi:MAG: aldehyde dehydrogenase family protein [Acidimicrobiaceae bacterium]|nr:aldehyde dehydrogenase family protein [Acidimicrobiaceae bacterium]